MFCHVLLFFLCLTVVGVYRQGMEIDHLYVPLFSTFRFRTVFVLFLLIIIFTATSPPLTCPPPPPSHRGSSAHSLPAPEPKQSLSSPTTIESSAPSVDISAPSVTVTGTAVGDGSVDATSAIPDVGGAGVSVDAPKVEGGVGTAEMGSDSISVGEASGLAVGVVAVGAAVGASLGGGGGDERDSAVESSGVDLGSGQLKMPEVAVSGDAPSASVAVGKIVIVCYQYLYIARFCLYCFIVQ